MTPTAGEIQDWIVARIADLTGLPPAEVDVRAPLTSHGVDSVALIRLAFELETWLGYRFTRSPLERATTVEELARFLAGEIGARDVPG